MSEHKSELAESVGSEWRAAWKRSSDGRTEGIDPADFRIGWEAAMRSIWDRLPAPDFARDPMTPREVGKLLDYVRANLPPNSKVSDGGGKRRAARMAEARKARWRKPANTGLSHGDVKGQSEH